MNKENAQAIRHSRDMRLKLLADPYRPRFHICAPEGICLPFDPNGALYWKESYHLFYIFQDENNVHCWGHVSSHDLLHWIAHPTALKISPEDPETGIFSGAAFIGPDGMPRLIYHGCESGNSVAVAQDDRLDTWEKLSQNPITSIKKNCAEFSSWDPHAWTEGNVSYAIYGGSQPALFKSEDCINWDYCGPFISPAHRLNEAYEDYSCPDFFHLGDQDIFMFISHARGTQYYTGRFEREQFIPESMVRLNYPGGQSFANESLLDDQNRRLFWVWILDTTLPDHALETGWSGVMSLPRHMQTDAQKQPVIEPAAEITELRKNMRSFQIAPENTEINLGVISLQTEIKLVLDLGDAAQTGIRLCSKAGEVTDISYSLADESLKIDVSQSVRRPDTAYPVRALDIYFLENRSGLPGIGDQIKKDGWQEGVDDKMLSTGESLVQKAPFSLKENKLVLDIFFDGSVLEVFPHGSLCLSQRVYFDDTKHLFAVFYTSKPTQGQISIWDMQPTNFY